MPIFEFNQAKSEANKAKHGIDFVEAQDLWLDENRSEIDAFSKSEQRFGLVAVYNGKLWMAVWTLRGEAVRLISVRRARTYEEQFYEKNFS